MDDADNGNIAEWAVALAFTTAVFTVLLCLPSELDLTNRQGMAGGVIAGWIITAIFALMAKRRKQE